MQSTKYIIYKKFKLKHIKRYDRDFKTYQVSPQKQI